MISSALSLPGEVFYWLFLVLWSLFAAYIIVIRQVQNSVAESIKKFLFSEHSATPPAPEIPASHAPQIPPVAGGAEDGIDDFIVAQLKRTK